MFQSSTILPITQKPEPSSYNWKQWAKAGLVFAGTLGTFLALKTTGSFSLISGLFKQHNADTEAGNAALTVAENEPINAYAPRSGQPPVLVNNTLIAKQGVAVTLTNYDLAATDIDDDDANLVFMITNEQHGQFENVANPGIAISAFTQQQITDGNVCFMHDGSDIAPLYKVIVSDGTSMTEAVMPEIGFMGFGEISNVVNVGSCGSRITIEPYISGLSNGKFAISWDCSGTTKGKIFNLINLTESGEFALPNSVRPRITNLQNGKFVVVYGRSNDVYGQLLYSDGTLDGGDFLVGTSCNALGPLHDIAGTDKFLIVWAGIDSYVYGRSYNSDGTVYRSDFKISTSAVECSTGYMENMDTAELVNGAFVVVYSNGGDRAYTQVINIEGSKQGAEILVTSGGALEDYGGSPLAAGLGNGGFVVAWSNAGLGFKKYGKLFNATGSADSGVLQLNNEYSSGPGLSKIGNDKFVFTWSVYDNQECGSYEGHVGMRIYYDDATIFRPDTKIQNCVKRSDGTDVSNLGEDKFCITWNSEYAVHMKLFSTKNLAPQIINNHLTINESETQVLTDTTLSAIDVDNYNTPITLSVSDVQHGRFTRVSTPGTTISSFTQTQIDGGQIQFIHDGDEDAPSYKVSVSCGGLQTLPVPAAITFANINDIPELGNNELTINAGEIVIFNTDNLSGTDIDNNDDLLTFTISESEHGQFELVSNPGIAITSFMQQQITSGNIQFVHDDGEFPPAYKVTISDGQLTTSPVAAYILFNPQMTPIAKTGDIKLATASHPLVAGLIGNNFVAIWESGDGSGKGVYGRIFSNRCTTISSEFRVNDYTVGDQVPTGVIGLTNAGFVVTWQSDGQDGESLGAYARVFDSIGVASSPDIQLAISTAGMQYQPRIISLSNNDFVTTWTSDHLLGFNYGYSRVFSVTGVPLYNEFRTSGYFENHFSFAIDVTTNNDFYIVTRSEANRDGSQSGIFAQKFTSNTTLSGSEFQVNTYTTDRQDFPDISVFPESNHFIIVWQNKALSGTQDIQGQIFYNDNSKSNSELLINEYTIADQEKPTVVALRNDTFIVAWQSNGQDGSGYGIYGRRYSDKGVRNGYEFRINDYTLGNQYFDLPNGYKTIAKLNNNEFVVVWYCQSQNAIYARVFTIGDIISSSLSDSPTISSSIVTKNSVSSSVESSFVSSEPISPSEDSNSSTVIEESSQSSISSSPTVSSSVVTKSSVSSSIESSFASSEPISSSEDSSNQISSAAIESSQSSITKSSVAASSNLVSSETIGSSGSNIYSSSSAKESAMIDSSTTTKKSSPESISKLLTTLSRSSLMFIDSSWTEQSQNTLAIVLGIIGGITLICSIGTGIAIIWYYRTQRAEGYNNAIR